MNIKKLTNYIIRTWFKMPYEVVNIENMYYNAELIRTSLFIIKCIKSCQTHEQLKTCSGIMHTHLTCRFIGHALYVKYWEKVLKHYHFRLKLIDLITKTQN